MKMENLVFQKKCAWGGGHGNYSYPNVTIKRMSSGHKEFRTKIAFRCCDNLYSSNKYCVYAIAGNRLYFMFCGDSRQAYKMHKPKGMTSEYYYIAVQYNKEMSKFIRNEEYTPKLDNECGLWYIEY